MRSRSSVDVGATSWIRRNSGCASTGRSATMTLVAPALARLREALVAVCLEQRGVRHRHDRRPRSARGSRRRTRGTRPCASPGPARCSAARRITGPSASGSEKGMPISTTSAPPAYGRLRERRRLRAGHEVDDERLPSLGWKALKSVRESPTDASTQHFDLSVRAPAGSPPARSALALLSLFVVVDRR